mgnify:CR=1 FL=1
MQKKFIALALASLAFAPAFAAETSVTVYGLVDMGYVNKGSNFDSAVKGRSAFESGVMKGSRFGVKAVEDLGNGISALATLEAGINADQGSSAQGGLGWGRQTFVGLKGNFGTVTLGRQNSSLYEIVSGGVDPFGLGTSGQASNIFTHITARIDNSLRYQSPVFGNVFSVDALYSTKVSGNEVAGNETTTTTTTNGVTTSTTVGDRRGYSIAPKFKFGTSVPVTLFAVYQDFKAKSAAKSDKSFDLGGTVDFKVVKLDAILSQVKFEASPIAFTNADGKKTTAPKHNRFHFGASVPFDNGMTRLASYNSTKSQSAHAVVAAGGSSTFKAQQLAIGGKYALSTRTNVYATYSTLTGNAAGSVYGDGDGSVGGLGYKRSFDLGINHAF